ncbi:MAG: hypothetical protein ACTHN3_12515 [Solirubrobacterales bacterium]
MPPVTPIWRHPTRLALGHALLAAEPDGLTPAEIAVATGKDQSNLRKLAEELVEVGDLREVKPPPPNGKPGRRARKAFAFTESGREQFEALLDVEDDIGRLNVGSHVVFVDSEEKVEALAEALSHAGVDPETVWVAELMGPRPELMVVFSGLDAPDDAGDLLGKFRAAELKARQAAVSRVRSAREQAKAARKRKQRIDQSRLQRRAMQTGPRRDADN